MKMHNPFFSISKADDLSSKEAGLLFVPEASPIWTQVQNPLNQLVVGPRGAGKTMALRQLDHHTQPKSTKLPYIGLYIQISRISTIFQSLFDQSTSNDDGQAKRSYQRIFSEYIWLEIIRELTLYLQKCESLTNKISTENISRFAGIHATDLNQLLDKAVDSQNEIDRAIDNWTTTNQYNEKPTRNLTTSLNRCVEVLRKTIHSLDTQQPCLYLLFDESSPIPLPCQEVINSLLHRGRSYCVKLAVRPYEWDTLSTLTNRRIELNTDVWPIFVEYHEERSSEYISQMSSLVDKVLHENMDACGFDASTNTPSIQRLLEYSPTYPYSGFHAVCATSSGNPQNLLQICSSIFQTGTTIEHPQNGIVYSPIAQDNAIRAWSREYEDRNPDAISRSFCRALLRRVRQNTDQSKTIGFDYVHQETELFTDDYMPDNDGDKIRPAFSTGFLRRSSRESTSLFEVPSSFHLSRGLLPREGIELSVDIKPTIRIDHKFVTQNAKDNIVIGQRNRNKGTTSYKAFLSTSFSPLIQQQRNDIKKHLQQINIVCKDLEDDPGDQFMYSSVLKLIRWCDFCILDATQLRPYTMVELGLCAGATRPKGVICIVNDDGKEDPIEELLDPLRKLHVLTFDFTQQRLQKLASAIYNRADEIVGSPSEFAKVSLTGVPFRSKRRPNTLYVSIPPAATYKSELENHLRDKLQEIGWGIVTDEDINTYGMNDLQVSIQGAYLARIGLVDTSGATQPDLYQCFKLGLFAGKRRPWQLLRIERNGQSHPEAFSSISQFDPFTWNTYDELVPKIVKFLSQ